MRILISGAAGFIGSHLVQALMKQEYEVIALDKAEKNPNFGRPNADQWIDCDISNKASVEYCEKTLKFDSMVHLAAIAAPNFAQANPDLAFAVNVLGTYHLLKMAKTIGAKRIIMASTAHTYGISPKYIPTDEAHPLSLLDTYTVSKVLGEKLCELFYTNYNLSYCVLRLFNGYGPGQSLGYFIPDIIEKAKTGKISLKGGCVTKDFVYIDDIVDAIVRALENCYVGPLNVGTGIQTRLFDVADIIAKHFNAKLVSAELEDKGPTHMMADINRIKITLNWKPQILIEEGLKRTIEWNLNAYI